VFSLCKQAAEQPIERATAYAEDWYTEQANMTSAQQNNFQIMT
jgi:hypothetical protein